MRHLVLLLLFCSATACSSSSPSTDQRAEALSYARDDISCTQDSDCCVVFDLCRNQGYVVGVADQPTVANLIASAEHAGCNKCMPPPVEVSCGASGFCVGAKLACGYDQAASANHCGRVAAPDGGCPTATPLNIEPAPPGKHTETVIGCGT